MVSYCRNRGRPPDMVGIVALMRRRHIPVRGSSQALLILGAVIPTVVGAAVISALTFWALPTGVALGEQHVLRRNIVAAATYCAVAFPIATAWGYLWMTLPANRQSVRCAGVKPQPSRRFRRFAKLDPTRPNDP